MTGKTILIVDDEPEFIEMIQMRLEANGYTVISAPDGQAGFEMAQSSKPGLILLDVMMPGQDGFETLRKLRGTPATRGVPVVMMTARSESRAILKAQNLGATDYLIKPCESGALLEVVRKHT